MKLFLFVMLMALSINPVLARDPGTGSNTTPDGAVAPATPDAPSSSTSIMGGGTPGNDGEDTFNLKDPSDENLRQIQQAQEERKKETEKDSEKSN